MPTEPEKTTSQAAAGGGFFGGFSSQGLFSNKPASGLSTKDDSSLTSSAPSAAGGSSAGSGSLLTKIAAFGSTGGSETVSGGMRRRATVANFGTEFDSIVKKAESAEAASCVDLPPAEPPTPSQLSRRSSMPVLEGGMGGEGHSQGHRGSAGNLWSWLTSANPNMNKQPSLLGQSQTIMESAEVGAITTSQTPGTKSNRDLNVFTPQGW